MSKPLFNNIKINDYLEPIRKLEEYYKDIPVTYYSDILKKYKNIRILNKNHEDILLQYLQCRPNAKIIVAFSEHDVTATKNKLKKETNFYYHKSVTMSKKEVIALMYQLLYDECSTYQNLKNYTEKLGFKDENRLEVYFYENTFFSKESMVKETKQNKSMVKKTKQNKNINKKEIELDMDHFTNDSFDELILMLSIFLNENSLELLRMQNIERLYKFKNSLCKKIFIELKNNFYKNLTLLELNSRIITSSFILYLYGFRTCNDVDVKYIYINKKYSRGHYIDLVEIPNDLYIENNLDKYISYYNMVIDPSYYLYFLGNKIITLDLEMKKKVYRKNRPRAFVDIIYVNEQLGKKYKLPELTKNDKQFYKTMKYIYKNKYNKNYDINFIKDLIKKYI